MGNFSSNQNEVVSNSKSNSGSEGNSSDGNKSGSEEKQSSTGSIDNKDKASLIEKKKARPSPKKKKIIEEPAEIFILSSDEEEESKPKKTELYRPVPSILSKEPDYSSFKMTAEEMSKAAADVRLNQNLMENLQPGQYTTVQCRTIRLGSYKVQPKERALLSSEGVKVVVPSFKNEPITITIPIEAILKTLIHFGKELPVIFIYAHPKIGCLIREALSMTNKSGPYYDPASTNDESHKRITILLEKMTEDNKIALHNIFGKKNLLTELSEKEANEILVLASPVETRNIILGRPTNEATKILVYPPPPEKGGITLNNADYACLGEDQFLNDVIIDFYLKYLLLKVLSPEDRSRTHVFSTFFYKRLTSKPKTMRKNDPENDPNLTPSEKRHSRVKTWTKKVNLFEKDFIIVPINEHSHWFLAIICFPGLNGPVRFSDNTPVEREEVPKPKKSSISKSTVQIGNTTITQIVKNDNSTINLEIDDGSDRDEAEGDQDDLHPSSDDDESEQAEEDSATAPSPVQIPLLAPPPPQKEQKPKPVKKKPFKEPIKQPCILIFDSLAGASRVRVVATLRDYLKVEYKKKFGQDREFSKDIVKGAVPKVPQQNNFTDCGLYVLQYVESFFQDPLHDFNLPLKYLQDWFPEEIVSRKRQELAALIRTLMEEQGINVDETELPTLQFSNGTQMDPSQMEEDEEEEEEEEEFNEEDNEELIKSRVKMQDFENEEDMELGEEEEIAEEEEDELELEDGQIPGVRRPVIKRQIFTGNAQVATCVQQTQATMVKGSIIKALVSYDDSDSEEEENQLLQSNTEGQQEKVCELNEDGEYCPEIGQVNIGDRRKNVPLTELQDFESQIRCNTIERNVEGRNSESDMIISDDEDVDNTEIVQLGNKNSITKPGKFPIEKKKLDQTEVKDILSKLVKEKSITVTPKDKTGAIVRKEEDSNSSPFKKQQIELNRSKVKDVKDCDKSEEVKKFSGINLPKTNVVNTIKRSSEALKSVRIQKKTDRNEFVNKRQKVDER